MRGLVAGSICIFIHSMITIISIIHSYGALAKERFILSRSKNLIPFRLCESSLSTERRNCIQPKIPVNSMDFLTPKELWGLERSSPKSSTKSLLCPRAICIGGSYQIPGAALTTTTTDHSIAYADIFTENQMLWPRQEFHSQKGFNWDGLLGRWRQLEGEYEVSMWPIRQECSNIRQECPN